MKVSNTILIEVWGLTGISTFFSEIAPVLSGVSALGAIYLTYLKIKEQKSSKNGNNKS